MDNQMTDEQVDNWRKVLCLTIGPYAFMMPVEQIHAMRDRFQDAACEAEGVENPFEKEKKPEKPKHDPFKSQKEFDKKNNWFQKALKREK